MKQWRNNVALFSTVLVYLLYMFILSIIQITNAQKEGKTEYKDLSASIIMMVLSSGSILTILIRGGMALIK